MNINLFMNNNHSFIWIFSPSYRDYFSQNSILMIQNVTNALPEEVMRAELNCLLTSDPWGGQNRLLESLSPTAWWSHWSLNIASSKTQQRQCSSVVAQSWLRQCQGQFMDSVSAEHTFLCTGISLAWVSVVSTVVWMYHTAWCRVVVWASVQDQQN